MNDDNMAATETTVGGARVRTSHAPSGLAKVQVRRSFAAGVAPTTAQQVWRIVSDFGGLKLIFPSLVRVYLSYPDAGETAIGTIRDMAFDPGLTGGPLNCGIEQLVALDHVSRRLAYVSVLGLPVTEYRSEMSVTGDDACELEWTSTCRISPNSVEFLDVLGAILAGGANQIASHLRVP